MSLCAGGKGRRGRKGVEGKVKISPSHPFARINSTQI